MLLFIELILSPYDANGILSWFHDFEVNYFRCSWITLGSLGCELSTSHELRIRSEVGLIYSVSLDCMRRFSPGLDYIQVISRDR